jgi:hypothetical protein
MGGERGALDTFAVSSGVFCGCSFPKISPCLLSSFVVLYNPLFLTSSGEVFCLGMIPYVVVQAAGG